MNSFDQLYFLLVILGERKRCKQRYWLDMGMEQQARPGTTKVSIALPLRQFSMHWIKRIFSNILETGNSNIQSGLDKVILCAWLGSERIRCSPEKWFIHYCSPMYCPYFWALGLGKFIEVIQIDSIIILFSLISIVFGWIREDSSSQEYQLNKS